MQELDTSLLLAINGLHTPLLDTAFWYITSDYFALLSFALVTLGLLWHYGLRSYLWFFLVLLFAIILSDGIITYYFKPEIGRLRPTHEPALEGLLHIVNGYRGGTYGFYSSHASNSAVLAVMAGLIFYNGWLRLYLFCYAFLFGLSRVYLGVHYPSDVMVGWVAGTLIGVAAYWVYRKLSRRAGYSERRYLS